MSHLSPVNRLLTGALLVATLLTGSVALGQTTPGSTSLAVGVYPTKQVDKFCLAIEKQPNTMATIQLLAPTGEELYAAHLPKKEARFHQIFNMNELQDGTYTLRIKQGSRVIVRWVQLRTTAPELSQPTRSLTVGN